jgi:lysophospholipase L1-like esterase
MGTRWASLETYRVGLKKAALDPDPTVHHEARPGLKLLECRRPARTCNSMTKSGGRHMLMPAGRVIAAGMLTLAALVGARLPAQDTDRRLPRLFLVGDSTVKTGTRGQQGWGDPLISLFDTAKIKVENHALGGRSSRTFQTEGRWDKVLAAAQKGDFVLIQMGHNDGGPLDDASRARGTLRGISEETKEIDNPISMKKEVVHTYGWYLRKYIADARAKGVTPIILAPIPHCPQKPVEKGSVEKNNYVLWAEEVAKAEKAHFVNLNKIIISRYAELTPADIKAKYFTSADNTHTSPAGAELNAVCVVEGLRELKDCPLKDYLLPEKK